MIRTDSYCYGFELSCDSSPIRRSMQRRTQDPEAGDPNCRSQHGMRRLVLIGVLFANASVFAQTENSDVFALGGGLHGLDHTTWTYEVGFIYQPATHFGIGLAYNNEGTCPTIIVTVWLRKHVCPV